MYAFVQNAGIGASRGAQLQGSLNSICGTSPQQQQQKSTTTTEKHAASNVRMLDPDFSITADMNYSITLQTLTNNPMPTISGIEDKDLICHRVWKQVFGNAYVMESERAEAYVAESMYRAGQIPLREFVRGVALSSTYRRRFFECCSPYRAVELNFKHLLGRGPDSQKEASEHIQRIANEGFEAEINSYIDSMEYETAFGDDYVPYSRFKGTYPTCEEFNRMCALNSSPGTTDKSLTKRADALGIDNPNHVLSLEGAGTPPKLVSVIAMNSATGYVPVKKGIPSRPDLEFGQSQADPSPFGPPAPINENADPVKRIEVVPGSYLYLNREEAEEYFAQKHETSTIQSMASAEVADAEMQIALLQAKVEELSAITN